VKRITQEAKKRQRVVEWSRKKGQSRAARQYGVSLSSVKRWNNRYDGTWQSLAERSHRPHSHPKQHTAEEESAIRAAYESEYERYGFDGVYDKLVDHHGYTRSAGGLHHVMKRLGLLPREKKKKKGRRTRPGKPVLFPGEKIQIDVKEVPFTCLRGAALRDGKHLYQWTAIDECTRDRFVYGYEEHTPENSVDFLKRLLAVFPFEIQTIQTDNGTEFTYRFISDKEKCPFETKLAELGITHKLIPPRTPWHNGKVERSHRNDQRYFYDYETFRDAKELNRKLADHLIWSNGKRMRVLGRKSPRQKMMEFIWVA
jgi:transposase InsO family protein